MSLFEDKQVRWSLPWLMLLCCPVLSMAGETTEVPTSQPVADVTEIDDSFFDEDFDFDDDDLDDIDLLNIDIPIIVTASRRAENILNVPYAISVVTAEEIRFSGARNVADAMRLAAGIDVANLGYGVHAISSRGNHGFLGNQSLVLVDGRQIYDSYFGGALWGAWPFMLEDIERIEVIRGPGGLTWGSNALKGVINIVTKDPLKQKGFTAAVRGGSRGSHKEYLGWATGDRKFRIRVSGEYEGSDGFEKIRPSYYMTGDEYKIGKMSLYAVAEPTEKDKFTLSGGSAVMNGGMFPMPMSVFDKKRSSGSQANYFLARWDRKLDEFNDLTLTTFVNDSAMSIGLSAVDYRYQQIGLQMQHIHFTSKSLFFTWGIDSRVDLFDDTNADPSSTIKSYITSGLFGVYGQADWKFAPKWALQAGARIDYDCYGGFLPSFRTSLSYHIHDDHMVYGAISRANHVPGSGLRQINMPSAFGLAYFTANRAIKNHSVMAYELGYRGKWFNKLETSAATFWQQEYELLGIVPRLGPPGLIQLQMDDSGASSLYGVELEAKYRVCKELQLLSNYTFLHMNWRGSEPMRYSNVIYPPRHKFMVGAIYSPWEDLHLSSFLYWVDSTRSPDSAIPLAPFQIDAYCRLDVRAEYEFWEDKASIAFGVQNLTDANHYEGSDMLLSMMEVPRMYYGQFRIHIPQE